MLANALIAAGLAVSCASAVPPPRAPQPASPPSSGTAVVRAPDDELAQLFARLVAQTNALATFDARYRAEIEGEELRITFAYAAPDKARLQWHGPGMNVDSWCVDGRLSVRGDFGKGAIWSDLDMPALLSLGEAFESALREEFPPTDAEIARQIGPGPILTFDVVADPAKPDGRSVQCRLGWDPARTYVLSWLAQPSAWRDARREGDVLVRDGAAGSVLALSTASGFYEWIRMKATLRLESLRVGEPLPPETFVVPDPAAGARDATDEMRQPFAAFRVVSARTRAYRAASKARFDEATSARKLARVFGALHAEVQLRALGSWRSQTAARITEFLATWEDEFARKSDEPSARQALDDAAAEWRKGLVVVLDSARESCANGLVAPQDAGGTKAEVDAVLALEQKAVREVFTRDTGAALLLQLDEGLRAIVAGG